MLKSFIVATYLLLNASTDLVQRASTAVLADNTTGVLYGSPSRSRGITREIATQGIFDQWIAEFSICTTRVDQKFIARLEQVFNDGTITPHFTSEDISYKIITDGGVTYWVTFEGFRNRHKGYIFRNDGIVSEIESGNLRRLNNIGAQYVSGYLNYIACETYLRPHSDSH